MSEKDRKKRMRARLRAKLEEKKIERYSNKNKMNVLESTFEEHGIDNDKFKESMEVLQKYGKDRDITEGMDSYIENTGGLDKETFKQFLSFMKKK